jgi:hypothetical protein
MILNAILVMLAIMIIVGIIRVIITPSENFGHMLMQMFFIDVMGDILEGILESIDLD